MDNEIEQDGFFSEMSYSTANDLATVIGRLLSRIANGLEPDWAMATTEINHRKMAQLIYGADAPEHVKARLGAFLLMEPLVRAKVTDGTQWVRYVNDIYDLFPAYYVEVLMGEHPEYTKQEAQAFAYLRYEGKREEYRKQGTR